MYLCETHPWGCQLGPAYISLFCQQETKNYLSESKLDRIYEAENILSRLESFSEKNIYTISSATFCCVICFPTHNSHLVLKKCVNYFLSVDLVEDEEYGGVEQHSLQVSSPSSINTNNIGSQEKYPWSFGPYNEWGNIQPQLNTSYRLRLEILE